MDWNKKKYSDIGWALMKYKLYPNCATICNQYKTESWSLTIEGSTVAEAEDAEPWLSGVRQSKHVKLSASCLASSRVMFMQAG